MFVPYALGLVIGFAAGLGAGISIGKKQKPWSELTVEEKKRRFIYISAQVVLYSRLWSCFSSFDYHPDYKIVS